MRRLQAFRALRSQWSAIKQLWDHGKKGGAVASALRRESVPCLAAREGHEILLLQRRDTFPSILEVILASALTRCNLNTNLIRIFALNEPT